MGTAPCLGDSFGLAHVQGSSICWTVVAHGVSEITYKQTHSLDNEIMKRSDSYKVIKAAVGAIAVALTAVAFYPVREFLAALLIFAVLSGAVGMALLIVFLVQELVFQGVAQLEARLACVRARHAAISGQPEDDHVLRGPRLTAQ